MLDMLSVQGLMGRALTKGYGTKQFLLILQEAQADHDRLGTGLMFTRNTQSSRRDSRTSSPQTNDLIRDSGSLEMSEIGLRMIFFPSTRPFMLNTLDS